MRFPLMDTDPYAAWGICTDPAATTSVCVWGPWFGGKRVYLFPWKIVVS